MSSRTISLRSTSAVLEVGTFLLVVLADFDHNWNPLQVAVPSEAIWRSLRNSSSFPPTRPVSDVAILFRLRSRSWIAVEMSVKTSAFFWSFCWNRVKTKKTSRIRQQLRIRSLLVHVFRKPARCVFDNRSSSKSSNKGHILNWKCRLAWAVAHLKSDEKLNLIKIVSLWCKWDKKLTKNWKGYASDTN